MSTRTLDTAIIPVAGLGTRMAPFTYFVPKYMAQVVEGDLCRTSLDYTLAECISADIKNLIMIVDSDGAEHMKKIFNHMPTERRERYQKLGKTVELEREEAFREQLTNFTVEYIVQPVEKYGTAIPFWLALNGARSVTAGLDYIAVTGGDDFVWHADGTSELALAKTTWQQSTASHMIMGVPIPVEIAPSKGVLIIDDDERLVKIIERPDGSFNQPIPDNPTANISRYIFKIDEILDNLDKYVARPRQIEQLEYRITDVINETVRDMMIVHRVQGAYLDTGTPQMALMASNYINDQLKSRPSVTKLSTDR